VRNFQLSTSIRVPEEAFTAATDWSTPCQLRECFHCLSSADLHRTHRRSPALSLTLRLHRRLRAVQFGTGEESVYAVGAARGQGLTVGEQSQTELDTGGGHASGA